MWSTFKLWKDTESMKKIGSSYTGQQIFMKISETTKLPFTSGVGSNVHCIREKDKLIY